MEAARVARGTLYIVLQNVIQYFVLFIFYVGIARILTQAEVGQISLLLFMIALFNTLTQFSIPVGSEKFVSENIGKKQIGKASAVARTAFKLLLATSLPSLAVISLLSPQLSILIFGGEVSAPLLVIVFTTALILNLTTLYGANMLGLGMFAEMVAQNLTFVIVGRGLALFLAWLGYRVTGVIVGWLIGAIVCLVISLVLLKGRFITTGERIPPSMILAYGYPILIYTIVNLLQGWIDVLILYKMTSSLAVTGLYHLTASGAWILSIFWAAVNTAVFPALSALYGKDKFEGVSKALRVSTRQLNLIVIPAGVSLASISHTAITVAYGSGYLAGTIPFAILTITAVIPAYGMLFITTLQAIGETKVLIKIGTAAVVVDTLVMLMLAGQLNVIGAAIARLMTFTTVLLLSYQAMRKRMEMAIDTSSLGRIVLASTILGIVLATAEWTFLYLTPLPPSIRLSIDFLLFVGIGAMAMRAFRVLKPDDFELLRMTVPRSLHNVVRAAERLLV